MERLANTLLSCVLTLIGIAALVSAVVYLRADQAFVAAVAFLISHLLIKENRHDNA